MIEERRSGAREEVSSQESLSISAYLVTVAIICLINEEDHTFYDI